MKQRIIFTTIVLFAIFVFGLGLSVGQGSSAEWVAWTIFLYAAAFGASFAVMGIGIGVFLACLLPFQKPRERDLYGEWWE